MHYFRSDSTFRILYTYTSLYPEAAQNYSMTVWMTLLLLSIFLNYYSGLVLHTCTCIADLWGTNY